jgi:hypothetical protein
MTDTRQLRKAWRGILGGLGVAAPRRRFSFIRLGGDFDRTGGGLNERRRGWGTIRNPSAVPGAVAPMAINGARSGSTRVDTDSPALEAFRGDILGREAKARKEFKGGWLGRSVLAGDLAKRAGDGVISDAEREQRRAAGKASAEARRKGVPGGPKFSPTRRSLYSQYVPTKGDRAGWDAMPDVDQGGDAKEATGPFVRRDLKPQVPKTLGEDGYVELGRWASQATRDARPDLYERAAAKGLLPGEGKRAAEAKLDAKAVRLAYNHARNLAMHDVGLFRYDFAQGDEAIEQLKPLIPFMRYTRDSLKNTLLSGRPGEWAQFRREFGKEHADGRVHAFDTRGQKAGEKKRHFERRLNFLVNAEGKTPRLQDLGRQRVEKLAKAWIVAVRARGWFARQRTA